MNKNKAPYCGNREEMVRFNVRTKPSSELPSSESTSLDSIGKELLDFQHLSYESTNFPLPTTDSTTFQPIDNEFTPSNPPSSASTHFQPP